MGVELGLDVLLKKSEPALKKINWALVTNDAARTKDGIPSRSAILQKDWKLSCLFSPEHGLYATGADGAAQTDQLDPLTNLPVFSLYGPQFGPALENMEFVEGVLFDLPDTGVRFYTYLWTMTYLMEACMAARKPLLILDRPNPLSGQLDLAEGPMLDEQELSSFIGRWRIPIRHCLTFGELALYWQHTRNMKALDLQVIPCRGWKREQYFSDTGLPFFPPSPAINYSETFLTYPALCFLEGLNVNEGRGSSVPFQQFGAPWLDSDCLATVLNAAGFNGCHFEKVQYIPETSRYAGEKCQGVRLQVRDRECYRPIQTGIGIVAILQQYFSEKIDWATYPTHANPSGTNHLDLLTGKTGLRKQLEKQPEMILSQLSAITSVPSWQGEVQDFLLYE